MNSEQSQGYRNTIERLPPSNDMSENRMKFDVGNHDDLLDIMNRIQSIDSFQTAGANTLALGIKLFSGVMLANRSKPLFSAIQPEIRVFIGKLKARVANVQQRLTTGACS